MSYPAKSHIDEHVWVDSDDQLWIEHVRAVDLANRFGTPLFVTSEAQIRSNVTRFKEAFRSIYPDTSVFFATKANHGSAVRRLFTLAGAGGDAFGPGELSICLDAGTPPDMLVLNGSNKGRVEISMAISTGIPIHVDSLSELDIISEEADRLGIVAKVSPRTRLTLRPLDDMEADLPAGMLVGPGARGSNKFGMDWEATVAMCRRAINEPMFELVGMHHHVGRWNNELRVFDVMVREQIEWVFKLSELLEGWTPEYLDFGGGMASYRAEGLGPFGNDRHAPPIEEYARTIAGATIEELDRYGLPHPRLIVEPGRSLVSNTTVLLTEVGSVKRNPYGNSWVSVDASQNLMPNILTMNYYYHAIAAAAVSQEAALPVDIVGPLCSFDFLGTDRLMPPLEAGDIIAFLDTGGYCESKSLQFNAVPRPSTVLVNGYDAEVVVRAESMRDLIGRSVVPQRLQSTQRSDSSHERG